jgi:hypothetical protein
LLVEILITACKLMSVSTLRMHIDVAVLVENTRRIFGRAREGNLGSRRPRACMIFNLQAICLLCTNCANTFFIYVCVCCNSC